MGVARNRLIRTLALSAAGAAFALPALAQTEGDTEISGIIVTAQRRAENVQDVPITMTVVSQAELERQGITTTSELVKAIPALTVTDQGIYQIRSIGTQGFGRSSEQSVSVVLDGVVLGRAQTNAMFDLDHVEVLSGPQGTQFGKNATAGVINIVTKAPVLNDYQAIGHLDVGNHDYVNLQLTGNLPLGDKAALRIAYHHNETGNVVYNTLYDLWDHNTDDGVRARLLWLPTENLTVNISADYQKLDSNGVNGIADFAGVMLFTSVPAGTPLAATLAACGVTPGPRNNKACGDSLYDPDVDTGRSYGRWNGGASLQIDYEWGDLTLTSITAYRRSVLQDFDVDGDIAGGFGDTLPLNILQRNLDPYSGRNFSQELRVASPATDRVNFVAGLYYSQNKSHDIFDQAGALGFNLGGGMFRRYVNVFTKQRSSAAFGQVNFQATDKLELFAGARVTRDYLRDFSFNSFPGASPAGPYIYTGNTGFFSVFPINTCTLAGGNPDIPGSCPAGTSLDEPVVLEKTGYSGKLGFTYQANPDLMIFGTIARGYKGPFINEAASFPVTPEQLVIESEYPLDVELGFKATVRDRVAINASLFANRIKNFQTTIYVPPSSSQAVANFIQGNAPRAYTRGVEITAFGNVTENFSLNAGLLYNKAKFGKGFLVNCGALGPCEARKQLPYAPVWKATLSGEYRHDLGGGPLEGFVQGNLAYSSKLPYGSAPGFPKAEAKYLIAARVGVREDEGKWGLSVFCRNCLDKRYPVAETFDGYAALDGGTAANGAIPTVQFLSIDSYRVVGVTLDARF